MRNMVWDIEDFCLCAMELALVRRVLAVADTKLYGTETRSHTVIYDIRTLVTQHASHHSISEVRSHKPKDDDSLDAK